MKDYTVSATLLVSFEVEAMSKDEARRIVNGILSDCKIKAIENADNLESIESIKCAVEGELEVI